jgi:hypothetical protein
MRPRSTLVTSDCKVTLKCQFLFLPGTSAQTAANVSRYRDVTARFRILGKTWYALPFTFDSCDGGFAIEFAGGGLARPAKWEGLERKVGQG